MQKPMKCYRWESRAKFDESILRYGNYTNNIDLDCE